MQPDYAIAELCGTLNVTRSGYQAWARRAPRERAQAKAVLLPLITQAHRESRQTYAGAAYRERLAQAGVIPSMSRPGNCYDHAAMECFWSSLKRELVQRLPVRQPGGRQGERL